MSIIKTMFRCVFIVLPLIGDSQDLFKSQKNNAVTTPWPAYGNDAGGSRYSTLAQVNEGNVKQLKIAWVYRTGELATYEGTEVLSKAAFEATPVIIDTMLYFSTPTDRVIAVQPTTGKEIWVFDPKINLKKDYSEITSRGVALWPASSGTGKAVKKRRIFIGTIDGRLIALDAQSGVPVKSFGVGGTVDLKAGLGNDISMTSPPAVIGNLVIVGSSLGDNHTINYPRGTVRAYSAETGKLKWSWDPIPYNPKDPASKDWKSSGLNKTGAANAWSLISVDIQRDLVFIPTTSPSPDYYGGERLGNNLYGNSIVALRASTGKMIWHYQVVHHDLWDYDIAAQPMLINITRESKKVAAIAVGTKMGHIFILDRETGKPLFPVEERVVPASAIPGEHAATTQPFPVLPAPLGLQKLSVEDAWGTTSLQKERAEKRIGRYVNNGIFTPPSLKGTIVTPGNVGGIHWGGMCFDPKREILITNINRLAALIRLLPREKVSQMEKEEEGLMRSETGLQLGTPYVMKRDYFFTVDSGNFIMQTAPPWGTLHAINLRTGLSKWEVPLGFMMDTAQFPEARKWGSLNFGGAIVTAGNLIFIAASRDGYLRAHHTQTGEMLWESLLPAGGQATPMTYSVEGKQFIVIAAGGHGKFATKQGDYVVAYALPE